MSLTTIGLKKSASSDNEEILEQDVQEWVSSDEELASELSDARVVQKVVEEYENKDSEKSDDDTSVEERLSHEEGKNALQTALTYIEQQDHSTAVDIMFFKKVERLSLQKDRR